MCGSEFRSLNHVLNPDLTLQLEYAKAKIQVQTQTWETFKVVSTDFADVEDKGRFREKDPASVN